MTARTVRARTVTALALAGTLLLAGCTGDADEPAEGSATTAGTAEQPEGAGSDGGAVGPGTATVADQVMAEQTIATPHGSGTAFGGTLTVTLRSVEVGAESMTVRWALRWDDDEAEAGDAPSYYDMGVTPVATVTDRDALVAYRPYCTEGAWQSDAERVQDADLERILCQESMLVSPLEDISFEFPNHGTVEAWALLPAPEGRPATVDVAPAEGLPLFTDATVTYTDGGQG